MGRMRRSGLLILGLVALGLAPAVASAAPPDNAIRISGSDAEVWSLARPTPTYVIRGPAPGAPIAWRLSGSALRGAGPSPLRVSLPGLGSGNYRLVAEHSPPPSVATRTVRVDVTPPAITIRAPTEGAVYLPGQAVAADYSCSGGATACAGPIPRGAPLDTASAGPRTFTVAATDAAGNAASRTVAYRVGPAAPVITARPPNPPRGSRAPFAWSGGEPGAVFTWQVLSGGSVVTQGEALSAQVTVGPLPPGVYAFQVRQTIAPGRTGPFSVPDPFTAVAAGAGEARGPETLNADRMRPRAGERLTAARPVVLSWRPRRGAAYYNLQVYRVRAGGVRKVASEFPRRARMQVRGLRAGERYAWRAWPRLSRGGYDRTPVGVSYFDLVRPVRLDPSQMLVDRRIAQAALRRVAAIERWLAAGITGGDLRYQGLGSAVFDPALRAEGAPSATGAAAAAVRRVGTGALATPARPARVRVSAGELLASRRIAQAAVRRIAALEARLAEGLTGADVVDGSITPDKLAPGVALRSPSAASAPAAPSARAAPRPVASRARLRLRARELLVTQRISQAAARRAEALRARLEDGLASEDFRAGSLTGADLRSR